MSSRLSSETEPLVTAWVRLSPQYPPDGMVKFKPAFAEATPVC